VTDEAYNFAYLDEQTKRMIRRAILKGRRGAGLPGAVRQPRDADALWLGHRRRAGLGRLPDARGHFKVIDQGADDTTNAVSIRKFFEKTAGWR
jgi:alpha-D-ribose 1-methylphosphonate 5-phosphate C-P lyase